jgi:hypothetical protein
VSAQLFFGVVVAAGVLVDFLAILWCFAFLWLFALCDLFGVTFVVTVVVAVDLAPFVTIVFVVALAPEDELVFVVCASAGDAIKATAATDPRSAFMAFSPLQRMGQQAPTMPSHVSPRWRKG